MTILDAAGGRITPHHLGRWLAWFVVSCIAWLQCPAAASPLTGLPFTRFYSYEEIGGISRGVRLSFDEQGRLTVLQQGTFLVLNDEAWLNQTGPAPTGVKVEEVARGADGTIYYGGLGTWGFLSTTAEGLLTPQPLVPPTVPKWALLNTFNKIIPFETGVCFAGRSGVVYWDRATRQTTFIGVDDVARVFRMGPDLYVSTFDRGTSRLDLASGAAKAIADHPLSGIGVDHLASSPSGHALVSTVGRRLYSWDGQQLHDLQDRQLGGRLDGRISAIQFLPEGLFAVAIAGKGLLILDAEGGIITSLTSPDYRLISSLANNEPGVLWAATEGGVVKIFYGAPVTTFGQTLGLPVSWPQFVTWEGRTIVASNGRVFESVPSKAGEPARFQLMDPQPIAGAWGIAVHGPWLLLGNSEGVFARRPGEPFQTVLSDLPVGRLRVLDSGECLVIGEKQITGLRLEAGRWREFTPRVAGLGYPSMVHGSRKGVWIEIGANYAARLQLQNDSIVTRVFDSFPWPDPNWIHVNVLGRTVILNGPESGRVYFDEETDTFVDAPQIESQLQQMPYWPARIREDESGRWWVSHPHGIFTFDPAADRHALDLESYRTIHELAPLVQIMPGREVWATNGYILFNLKPTDHTPVSPLRFPRLISIKDLRTNHELIGQRANGSATLRFPYDENSLGLRFFAGTYAMRPTPEYETRLNRSSWNRLDGGSMLRLSDLREGSYRLEVRLVDPRGPVGEPTTLEFAIAPPWFRSAYAYGGYTLLAVGLGFGLVRLSLRREKARNLALERLVAARTAELKSTMTKLENETQTTATLAERNRLAGEIHDGVEQGFAGLALQLEAMSQFASCAPELKRELTVAGQMLAYSRNEMRHAVHNLYSPVLDTLDFEAALRQLLTRLVLPSLSATVTRKGATRALGSTIEHHLLRIAQEAITNVAKHAAAKNLEVTLDYGENEVQLSIGDDGRGFDPAVVLSGDWGHFGLPSFRSRAEKIGGTVAIVSRPGAGTRITVRVPYSSRSPL